MSVTFSIQQERTGWIHECGCGAAQSATPFESYIDAYLTQGLMAPCADEYCAMYAPFVKGVATEADALEINVSNVNARLLLENLGFSIIDEDGELDLCGSAAGTDLLGRVLMAQALVPSDAGMPAMQTGNIIDCGRHEGYMDERFEQLSDIATWAAAHNAEVVWS